MLFLECLVENCFKQSWKTDVTLQTIIANLKLNPASHPHYKWHNDELRRNGKLVAGNSLPLQQMLLSWFHNSSHGGHSGINATLHRFSTLFYWPKLEATVTKCIQEYVVCQRAILYHSNTLLLHCK